MATPYSDVYNPFLSKITDYDFLELEDTDKETILFGIMKSACTQFKHICVEDLEDRDDTTKEFTDTLTDESIDIITELMLVEWLKPKLYKSEMFENVLNTKDFSMFSPANLLKEMRETFKEAKLNAKKLMSHYSYLNS